MKINLLLGLISILICTGCVAQTQPTHTLSLDDKITCPCGCELNLKDCEINDPTCQTRTAIQDQIEKLRDEGFTTEQIIASFGEPQLPSIEEILAQIATEQESGHPVILYFYNETCSTCIKVKPMIQEIEERYPQVTFLKIEKRFHNAIFTQFNIETYPQLIVIIGGEEHRKVFSEKDDILSFVEEVLS